MTPQVVNNESLNRFELTEGGETAEVVYKIEPGVITFLHTGVPESLQGRGIAGQLAKAGLKFAREKRLAVVAVCPFIAEYIRRHPEEADLPRQ